MKRVFACTWVHPLFFFALQQSHSANFESIKNVSSYKNWPDEVEALLSEDEYDFRRMCLDLEIPDFLIGVAPKEVSVVLPILKDQFPEAYGICKDGSVAEMLAGHTLKLAENLKRVLSDYEDAAFTYFDNGFTLIFGDSQSSCEVNQILLTIQADMDIKLPYVYA